MDSRILKKKMTAAYQYSYVRLALNYYALLEDLSERQIPPDENITAFCCRMKSLTEDFLGKKDIKEELLCLRKDTIHQAEILDSYEDCFYICEYVLKRKKEKFKTSPTDVPDDETTIKQLMDYISGTGDMTLVNMRIQEILGRLPIRLTKQKFFSMVKEGLMVYDGFLKAGLEDVLYSLRGVSGVRLPKDMEKGHEALYEVLNMFSGGDAAFEADSLKEHKACLVSARKQLEKDKELYGTAQDIVNDFCVLAFARPDAVADVKEEEFYASLVTEILEKLCKGDYSSSEEEYLDRLGRLEGKQEAWYERYLREKLPQPDEVLGSDPDFIRAVNVDRLLSGSSFADLSDGSDFFEASLTVDRSFLEKAAEKFIGELEALFAGKPRVVVRAIMSRVLSGIPVIFNSLDETEEYIRGSLETCLDEKEKRICKELLGDLIKNENMLV